MDHWSDDCFGFLKLVDRRLRDLPFKLVRRRRRRRRRRLRQRKLQVVDLLPQVKIHVRSHDRKLDAISVNGIMNKSEVSIKEAKSGHTFQCF